MYTLGPFDYILQLLSFLAEVYVVVCLCLSSRKSFRYTSLNIYMFAAAAVTIVQFLTLRHFGVASPQYFYVYYYTDLLLTISLFFVIMTFYHQVFEQMGAGRYVRLGSILLLAATAAFSFAVVHHYRDHLTGRFVVEMGQNLYFVGVVLTYLLWIAVVKLRETRTRLIQLVLALGIFFSADAAAYAMRNLFPALQASILRFIPPLVGALLPLAWAYTFTKIPEEARLVTARVARHAPPAGIAVHQHS